MSHATTTSSGDAVDRLEGWLNSVYSDFKGFIFGAKTTSTSGVRGPTAPAIMTAPNEVSPTQFAVPTTSDAVDELYSSRAAPSVATATQAPQSTSAADTLVFSSIEPTRTSLPAYSMSSLPTASPSSSTLPAPPSHSSTNVNLQTLGFAALGALIVVLVYLLTPVVVRIMQFMVNATKLLFRRSSSFSKDSEMGLTSDTFSLTANIENEDRRDGLDKKSKLRILWYMLRFGETFDEARLRFVLRQFAQNGIGPEGEPLDPKYVTFDHDS